MMTIVVACTVHAAPEISQAAFGALTRTVTYATDLAPVALQV
jgi:hypothetical protein